MVDLRAQVHFKEPKITYNVLTEETIVSPNIINLDLFNFCIVDRFTLTKQFDFKPIDERDHMVNDYCDISGDTFLALVGENIEDAEKKLQDRDLNDTKLSAHNVKHFYDELQNNTIDKVTLRIVELW